jgi:hypothetical protein
MGWTKVGGILAHEYAIHDATIESATRIDAEKSGCTCAKSYAVIVRYRLINKLNIGLGLGSWVGTAERVSIPPSRTVKFDLPAVCCDPGYIDPELNVDQIKVTPLRGMAVVPAAAAAGSGGVVLGLIQRVPWPEVLKLAIIGLAIWVLLISPVLIALRFYWGPITDAWNRHKTGAQAS